MSGKWSRTRLVGTVILVLFGMSIVGGYTWLKYGPENNVRMWLDKTTVKGDESMTLYIRNLGSKSIGYGSQYYICRINENGTETLLKFEWAWTAELRMCIPFTTRTQEIYTDIAPGDYYLEKHYQIGHLGTRQFTKRLYFTIE